MVDPPLLDRVVPTLDGTTTVAADDGDAEHQGDDLEEDEGDDADGDGVAEAGVR
ncbi:MAG: hypothetical protein ACREOA_01120 [Candidatus Dormibacteria bacterium]